MSSLELKIEARRSAAITTENANKYFLVLEFIYLKSRAEKISIAIVIMTAMYASAYAKAPVTKNPPGDKPRAASVRKLKSDKFGSR